jgi:S-adenosylmethionine synthetase
MKKGNYIWTSEYVSPGHPDKIADQISDAILDLYLSHDKSAKVACETLVKGNHVYVAGEITSAVTLFESTIEQKIREAILNIGYDNYVYGFNGNTCEIHFNISQQSREIGGAVTHANKIAAGDQGIMFGYATRETPNFMPLPIYIAKSFITEAYSNIKKKYPFRPDMKSQVSLKFEDGKPTSVDSIVFSTCHEELLSLKGLRELFHDELLPSVLGQLPQNIRAMFNDDTTFYINPAGKWNIGGPVSDCGLTGRKIVVDQYGADCEIGGGAFSGKDPSKVDRSAAYMARHIALKTLQSNPEAEKIKVQLSYAIGHEYPVSYRIFDPVMQTEYELTDFTLDDLKPKNIIKNLGLDSPIYLKTANMGHFGIPSFTENGTTYFKWEDVDLSSSDSEIYTEKEELSHETH